MSDSQPRVEADSIDRESAVQQGMMSYTIALVVSHKK